MGRSYRGLSTRLSGTSNVNPVAADGDDVRIGEDQCVVVENMIHDTVGAASLDEVQHKDWSFGGKQRIDIKCSLFEGGVVLRQVPTVVKVRSC